MQDNADRVDIDAGHCFSLFGYANNAGIRPTHNSNGLKKYPKVLNILHSGHSIDKLIRARLVRSAETPGLEDAVLTLEVFEY